MPERFLQAGERGCEVCGDDLAGRIVMTRFCRPCMATRTRKNDLESLKKRIQARKDNGLCVQCGTPATGTQHCDFHREKTNEAHRKTYRKKTEGAGRYLNCEVCGCLIRKNGNVKYCRPCSVGPLEHDRRRREKLRERGFCTSCERIPAKKDRKRCEECLRKEVEGRRRMHNRRKEQGLCTQCGKVPKGKTLRCDKCRLDKKRKELRREMRKEG